MLGKEKSPKYSAIYKRINKINLEDDNGKSWFSDGKIKTEIVFLSGDSTGLKSTSRGDWMGKKWDVKRGFINIWLIQKLGKFMQYQLRMRNQVMHQSLRNYSQRHCTILRIP